MKIFLLVLDGGGDVGERTPYMTAKKPNIDSLASKGICGLLDVGYKKKPESDFGYLNILGFYDPRNYPGRGYLECLGVGMEDVEEKDLCIRGNFATLDMTASKGIIDRRAGRDETGLEELVDRIDGIEIDGVHFSVRKSAGHRVVVVMRPLDDRIKLSTELTSNDPDTTGVPVLQIKARKASAKQTASILNKFVARTSKMLSEEQVNSKRELPANLLLLRGFGRKTEVPTFEAKYGMSSCCIAGIPIVKGVATFLGMDIITVPGATGYPDTNLEGKFRKAFDALGRYDFVWMHINALDILSHDRKRSEKAKFLEKIDGRIGEMLKKMDLSGTVFVLTSDHRTASDPSYPYYSHTKDPNPILVCGGGIKPDSICGFDESSCSKGFTIRGNGLMEFVLDQIK